jgi:hypothetical protein
LYRAGRHAVNDCGELSTIPDRERMNGVDETRGALQKSL